MRHYTHILLLIICLLPCRLSAQVKDSDRLGMAINYFQDQQYHECLLILADLDKTYKLNPRFRAYLAVCHYYEWNFAEASKIFVAVLPQLQGLAPHEQSFYLFATAESLFYQDKFAEARPYYQQMMPFCYPNERGDAYYKIAFCLIREENYVEAYIALNQALTYYQQYRNTQDTQPRIRQIENMLYGCAEKMLTQIIAPTKSLNP